MLVSLSSTFFESLLMEQLIKEIGITDEVDSGKDCKFFHVVSSFVDYMLPCFQTVVKHLFEFLFSLWCFPFR